MIIPFDGTLFAAHAPVVIIGGGAAGMVAALAARAEGADVVVLERDRTPSGSTALSAGLIPAADTPWQRAAGIDDHPDRFAADILRKAHGAPDPAMVERVTRHAAGVVTWLAAEHGLPFSVVDDFDYPGHSARRMHGLPGRSGAALMDGLARAAELAGADVLTDAQATGLVADADRIVGVQFQRPDGAVEQVGCDALVLACNGYGGNPVLVARHVPALARAIYFGHPGNQGDALAWGEALGAAVRDLPGHQGHGSIAHPAGILISWATMTEGGFQVTTQGERFSDESLGYSEQGEIVLRQPGGLAWSIFDARIAAVARQFEDFRRAEAIGAVVSAGSAEALGSSIRAEKLAATMQHVAALKQGVGQDRFGRAFRGVAPLVPPFQAVRVTGALLHTQGGLVVDGDARVLRPDRTPLPNLFAAGGAACGVSGPLASGYLSGNGLLTAVTLGEIAGRAAARRARHQAMDA